MLAESQCRGLFDIIARRNSDAHFSYHAPTLTSQLSSAASDFVDAALQPARPRLLTIVFGARLCSNLVALVKDLLQFLLSHVPRAHYRIVAVSKLTILKRSTIEARSVSLAHNLLLLLLFLVKHFFHRGRVCLAMQLRVMGYRHVFSNRRNVKMINSIRSVIELKGYRRAAQRLYLAALLKLLDDIDTLLVKLG